MSLSPPAPQPPMLPALDLAAACGRCAAACRKGCARKPLAEIAENLHREELTALERAEKVAEWKNAFLARNPTAGHGKTPGKRDKTTGQVRGKKPKEDKLSSFGAEMEKATGKDARTSRRDCQIAENIPQELRDKLRGTPTATKQSELLKLAHFLFFVFGADSAVSGVSVPIFFRATSRMASIENLETDLSASAAAWRTSECSSSVR